jgi:hypothetical protein
MRVSATACQHLFEQTQFTQNSSGIRPEHHARANLAELLYSFVNRYIDADSMKSHGRGNPSNATSNNRDAFLGALSHPVLLQPRRLRGKKKLIERITSRSRGDEA